MGAGSEFARTPVYRLLGFELIERSAQGAEVRAAVRTDLLQEEGVVHGGILSTLADAAAVYAFYPDLAPLQSMTSIEFKLNFLRPATTDGGDLVARSRVVQRGRRVGVCDVEVAQGEKAVARGLFTYMFFERK